MTASPRTLAHLQWAIADVNKMLGEYDEMWSGARREAKLHRTGEFFTVDNFPLPNGYYPDYCDILVLTDDYPARPPTGLYLLNTDQASIQQIEKHFNAFRDDAFYDAPSIPGYTWICYHFHNFAWRYREDDPASGDTLRKFLAAFIAELAK